MELAAATSQLPADGEADIAYVRANFRPLDPDARELVEQGILPRATYVLPDGTPMIPADHAALLGDAGHEPPAVAAAFRARFLAAGGAPEHAEEELAAWLSGEYGACLHSTTPEAIVAKDALVRAIGALLADARPADARWCDGLRGAVDALDALERPFAAFDRIRFGGPTSRDRLIVAPRTRFPELWA